MLSRLYEEATDPACPLQVAEGDIVAWDNAAVIHAATFTRPRR